MANIVQHRRGTTADWEQYSNFILEEGEIAIQYCPDNTVILKVGDGRTPYAELKSISAATENLDDIIAELEVLTNDVNEIKTYITENPTVDGLEYTDSKLYLTANGQVVSEGVEIIGGSGGGAGAYIDYMLESGLDNHNLIAGKNQICNLPIRFISKKMPGDRYTGNYNCSIYVGDLNNSELKPKATLSCVQLDDAGNPQFINIDVSPYLLSGENSVKLTCVDKYGNSESLVYNINVISLSLASSFDDSTHIRLAEDGSGSFRFDFTPTGGADVAKTVYFVIDGEDESQAQTMTVTSSVIGQTMWVDLSNHNSHGIHTLDVYMAATINGILLVSNHLRYDLMVIDTTSNVPFISSFYAVDSVSQGDLVSIPYTVYDVNNDTPTVTLTILHEVDGELIQYSTPQQITINSAKQYWNTRDYPIGNRVVFRISYHNITMNQQAYKEHVLKVTESSVKAEPVTENLELALTSANRSNQESNPGTWEYNGQNVAFFEDFNWTTNGWVKDDLGDTCLRVSGKSKVTINFKPFEKDFKEYGKTIDLEFAIRDVNNRNAVPLSCIDIVESNWLGLKITPDTAILQSAQNAVSCNYKEDQKIRISICVEPVSAGTRFISIYLDGVLSGVVQYTGSDLFNQAIPRNITIGSEDCSIDIYNIRIYDTYLNAKQVLQNYIAGTSDLLTKINIQTENDIYNPETLELSYSKLKEKIPTVTFIGKMPTYKGDKKKKSVRMIFEHPTKPELNFDEILAQIDVQGTSSAGYVRKNWKTKHNDSLVHMEGELPAKVFCLKVDYAEATGTHNTQNANFVETLYSEKVLPQYDDERVRTTIAGYPIVIFHLDTDDTHLINNITKNELAERNDVKFSSKGNFNFDKEAENVFGFTSGYDTECWEFCNNTSDCVRFLGPVPTDYSADFEARYHPELGTLEDLEDAAVKDPTAIANLKAEMIKRFKVMHDWVVSTNTDQATNEPLDESYIDVLGKVYESDTKEYRLAKFRDEFENYFDLHYTAIYYVYTFFALMVDQRAKNLFLTYWHDKDDDGNVLETGKWFPYFYDNDTSYGINNEGKKVFDYYNEDTDVVDGQKVYNGQDSTLWCNFRECFPDYIRNTYAELRAGALTEEKLINQIINEGSSKWSASVYNEDAEYKYVSLARPEYDSNGDGVSDATSTYLYQVTGDGESHFRYFVNNRLRYCDSKWYAGDYFTDQIYLRIYTPTLGAIKDGMSDQEISDVIARNELISKSIEVVKPNADITLTPFSNVYAGVRYKAVSGDDITLNLQQERVSKNAVVTFSAPLNEETGKPEVFNDTETYIYGASDLSSLGDLAPLYCGYVDASKATKLTKLKIGDSTPGYTNLNLHHVDVGTNALLKEIDISNCPNLTNPLVVSNCQNIEKIYAKGSGITSVELPDAGYINTLELPETITSLVLTNQIYLTDISLDSTNITTLRIENCPKLNIKSILERFKTSDKYNIGNLRLIGLDWTGENAVTYEFMESLSKVVGITDKNIPTTYAYLSGTCEILDDMTSERMSNLKKWFPQLNIIFHNLSYDIIYMDTTGTVELYKYTETIDTWNTSEAYDIKDPIAEGLITDEQYLTKDSTVQYDYSLGEYKYSFRPNDVPDLSALRNVFRDTTLYIAFEQELRSYPINFYLEDTYLGTVETLYGHKAVYEGAELLVKPNTKLPYKFSHWSPDCSAIEGPMDCYAQFELDRERITSMNDLSKITYTVNNTNMTVAITSFSYTDPFCSIPPVLTINDKDYTVTAINSISNPQLVYIELPNTLTTIGSYTFQDCIALETIDIPDSVSQIGSYAFLNCISLKSIKLPQGNPQFTKFTHQMLMGCISLETLEIPSTVTYLDSMSIYKCSALTSITIPDSVTDIGMFAFKVCSALQEVNFNGIPSTINSQAFEALPGLTAGHITFNVGWTRAENHGEPWSATSGKYTINYKE